MTKYQVPNPKSQRSRHASGAAPRLRLAFRLGMWVLGFWVLGFGVLSTGCAKARAETVPDGPPLAVPMPPARVIVPPTEPQVAEVPPAIEPPPAVASPPPPRTASRPNTPAQPAASAPAPTPAVPAAETPRASRPTAADLAEERKIQAILQRATRDLNRVTYQRLNTDGRAQYDQSKRLAEQADEAIKDRNWVFAVTLADKAALLAAELLAR